ncbi:hypothetical protein PSE10B_51230 [Pseudomonas amygdali pv. eriobotryae]|nr:hypothetical protein PSE10B_51230 [Pseudomonas amygdali pv. eriobotryae]
MHSDIWRGLASDLAGLGMIGVYPAPCWWKTLVKKKRFNESAKYSLFVSIKTEETTVDLYNAVDVVIANRIAIMT